MKNQMRGATEQFKMRISPKLKKMLDFIAEREGRSKANLISLMIIEKYEQLKGKPNEQLTQGEK